MKIGGLGIILSEKTTGITKLKTFVTGQRSNESLRNSVCDFAAPLPTYSLNMSPTGRRELEIPRDHSVEKTGVIGTTNLEFQLVNHKFRDLGNQNLVTSRPCVGEQGAQIAKIRKFGGILCAHIARQGLGTVREVIGQLWIWRIGRYGPNCYQD